MCATRTVQPVSLNQAALIAHLRSAFQRFTDRRTGKNCRYRIEDAAASAFSVFFMQCPSFLEFQRSMQECTGANNAQSLFGVHDIPSDNHIRALLDETPASTLDPVFDAVFEALLAAGVVDGYRALNATVLLALDGTRYFSSPTLHCPQCSSTRHANGRITYSHTVVTPVVVKPGEAQVIPLAPEFVAPQDGTDKQDCELAAAKRWLDTRGARYRAVGVTLLGDDLYCHEPFCRLARERGFHFLFVCKPESHPTVYEGLADLERIGQVQHRIVKRWTGSTHLTDTYRFARALPLRATDDALRVDWCELTSTAEDGRVLYRNAFATSHGVRADNVAEVIASARARWKIENENNNILKTKGYHFEHNYGHGKKHLASLLATLIIMAYLFHSVLHWADPQYRQLRERLCARQRFFNDLRTLSCYLKFDSWEALLAFMIQALDQPFTPHAQGKQSP